MTEFAAAGGLVDSASAAVGKGVEILQQLVDSSVKALNKNLDNRVLTLNFPSSGLPQNFLGEGLGDAYNFKWEIDRVVKYRSAYASHMRWTASSMKTEERFTLLALAAGLEEPDIKKAADSKVTKPGRVLKDVATLGFAELYRHFNENSNGMRDKIKEIEKKLPDLVEKDLTDRLTARLGRRAEQANVKVKSKITGTDSIDRKAWKYFEEYLKRVAKNFHADEASIIALFKADKPKHPYVASDTVRRNAASILAKGVTKNHATPKYRDAEAKCLRDLAKAEINKGKLTPSDSDALNKIAETTALVYQSSDVRSVSVCFETVYEILRINQADIESRWRMVRLDLDKAYEEAKKSYLEQRSKSIVNMKRLRKEIDACIADDGLLDKLKKYEDKLKPPTPGTNEPDPKPGAKPTAEASKYAQIAKEQVDTLASELSEDKKLLHQANHELENLITQYDADVDRIEQHMTTMKKIVKENPQRIGRFAIYPVAEFGGMKTDIRFRNTNATLDVATIGRPDGAVVASFQWFEESVLDLPIFESIAGNKYYTSGEIVYPVKAGEEPEMSGKFGNRAKSMTESDKVYENPNGWQEPDWKPPAHKGKAQAPVTVSATKNK